MWNKIEFILTVVALVALVVTGHEWNSAQRDQEQLRTLIETQNKQIATADAQEMQRSATVSKALQEIENLKKTTRTPFDALRMLPRYLPLPEPITMQKESVEPHDSTGTDTSTVQQTVTQTDAAPSPGPRPSTKSPVSSSEASSGAEPTAQVPINDLKPLFDFAQDCRACQEQLAAARLNAADDSSKLAATSAQRDAAVNAARGGSFLHRLRRELAWFAAGATLGYVLGAK